MNDTPPAPLRSSFPALCLFLSIFFMVFAGMILCDCPNLTFISAVFAGLAFWRGTIGIRIPAAIIFVFATFVTVAAIVAN